MIKRVQLIGHTTSGADVFLGRVRELTVDFTLNVLRLHNGATVGGIKIAREDVANVPAADAVTDGKMTASQASDLSTVVADFATHDGGTAGHPVATPSVDGFESAADKTKLDGIEALADVNPTPAEILADLLTVDGSGSGLDADLLDGLQQTSAQTVNTIMRRDSAGRARVVNPVNAQDIASKAYADAATGLVAGDKLLFPQAAAPTGWVKDTDQNNKALRIVSGGTGGGAAGATAFSSVFGSGKTAGGTTLTAAQSGSPAHSHSNGSYTAATGSSAHIHAQNRGNDTGAEVVDSRSSGSGSTLYGSAGSENLAAGSTVFTASGGAHSHDITGTSSNNSAASAASSHNHTLSLDLQYVDIIKCTKS